MLVAVERGEIIGIAPFYSWRGTLSGVPVRRLDFAGHNFSIPNFIIRTRAQDVINAFLDFLHEHVTSWDVMVIKGPPTDSEDFSIISNWLTRKRYEHCHDSDNVYVIDLMGTWENYLTKKGRNLKKQLTRASTRTESIGALTFHMTKNIQKSDLVMVMDQLCAISLNSWKGKDGSAIGSRAHVEHFYRQIAEAFNESGELDISTLTIGGKDIAYLLGLSTGGVYYPIDTAYDRAYESASPGTLVNLLTIKELFNRGYQQCVSEGDHAYKNRWATSSYEIAVVTIFSGSLRSRLSRTMRLHVRPGMQAAHSFCREMWANLPPVRLLNDTSQHLFDRFKRRDSR